MSTDTDRIFGAGLLNMLGGVKQDMEQEEQNQAELVRQEGLARLNQKISQQNAASGWVMRDTGKPIRQSELESVPPNQRVAAGDYQLSQAKKGYEAQQEWGMPEKLRQEQLGLEKEQRGYADRLAREKEEQRGMTEREQLKQKKIDERAELKRKEDEEKPKKGGLTELQRLNLEDKMEEKYQEYASGATGELDTGKKKGLLGFRENVLLEPMSFKDWLKKIHPDRYRLLYGRDGRTKVADGKKSATSSFISAALGN